MKTTLTYLALATVLMADASTPTTNDSKAFIDWASRLSPPSFKTLDLTVRDGHEPILEISGFKTELPPQPVASGPLAGLQIRQPRYLRPENPENVSIIIWTADGRKWVAKWEEVK